MMELPPIPTDRKTWESEIATYWWEEDYLVSLSKSTLRTVDRISENVDLVKDITNGKPPILMKSFTTKVEAVS